MIQAGQTERSASAGQIAENLGELSGTLRAIDVFSEAGLAKRAERLAERATTERFHIAVLGDFKRGKSTLINAFLAQATLPSGVIPLTSVATEVHIGATDTTVVFRDGSRQQIEKAQIEDYVTERGNPSNAKQVDRVEVGVESPQQLRGLVLVDTPGLSSVNQGNTEEAHGVLRDSDAAIVVLGADNPLSVSELDLLTRLSERGDEVFVVINKVDHLLSGELEEVCQFVVDRAEATLGRPVTPFCVSARIALESQRAGIDGNLEGFGELRNALVRFVRDDLARSRRAATWAEFGRLASDVNRLLQLEEAAIDLDLERLEVQVRRLNHAANEGARQLADDVVVLGRDVQSLLEQVGRVLAERADSAARDCVGWLDELVASLPRRQLDRGTRDAIEALVRTNFETIRVEVAGEAQTNWESVAARFSERVQGRVDALVEVASDLFKVSLPRTAIPGLSEQRARFSYHFLYVEGQNAGIGHLAARLLPGPLARRRAQRRSRQRLIQEFNKHAGRARYDTAERLAAAKSELVESMLSEFEQTQASLVFACSKARALCEMGAELRSARAVERDHIQGLLVHIGRGLDPENVSGRLLLEREPHGQTSARGGQADQGADNHVPPRFQKSTVFDQPEGFEREGGERGVSAAEPGSKEGSAEVREMVIERHPGEESQEE
jgi:GTPase SAR1 family protein